MTDLIAALHDAIDDRRERAEAATEGPWRWVALDMTKSGKLALVSGQTPIIKAASADVWPSKEDADYIQAESPNVTIRNCTEDQHLLLMYEDHLRLNRTGMTNNNLADMIWHHVIRSVARRYGLDPEGAPTP